MKITDLMKLAALAEAHNMTMEPHDFGGGTASLHSGLVISNRDYDEQAAPEGCLDSEIDAGVYLEPIPAHCERYVQASTGPVLGFPIDLKEAARVASEIL